MAAIAVVGLGAMGGRIARRFLAAGHDVVVWNRDARKGAALAAHGATPVETPAEAAARVEVAVTMVADDAALRAVSDGPSGLAAGADGVAVVQMSTVSPQALSRLAESLPARASLVDVPVLGSIGEVEAGALTLFAGGDRALVEWLTPLLSALGSVVHVGPLGAGTAAKLVANSTLFGVLGVLGEAHALAERLGLPPATAFEVLARTPLAAQAERRRPAIESGEFPVRFALALADKDARLILDAAAGAGADVRVAAAAASWLADAREAGRGELDYSAVLAWIRGER